MRVTVRIVTRVNAHSTVDPTAFDTAEQAAAALREKVGVDHLDLALVLGSGWSAAADQLGDPIGSCVLADLPGFSAPTVAGHGGELRVVRTPNDKIAAILTGRTHFYEGKGVDATVHGVRTVAAAGASTLLLTNGCGSINPGWGPGTPVLLRDHINLTGDTPLRGPTFIDLSEAYSPRLRALGHEVDPSLPEGVYVQFRGPQYETPAEVRMAQVLGGDLVGMSTTLETIAARALGMEVLGISLATNLAAGVSATVLNHEEVIEAGRAAAPRLQSLLRGLVEVL